ncbi:MAG: hypothetical protein ACHQ2Z_11795, partial [Elusimicrobiota bacterium]
MKIPALKMLESARWLDMVETSPLVAGDARFLREYFLPAHGRYRETLYQAALAGLDGRASRGEDAPGLARRGRVRRILGDRRGAEADFAAALKLDANCPAARAFRAEMNLVRDPLGVLPELEAAHGAEPRSAACALWLAYARALAGDEERALGTLDRAVGLDPAGRAALILRGILRERRDDLPGAESDYSAVVKLRPSCPGIYVLRATVRWKRGDRDKSAADADRALLLHPENLDGFMRILYLSKNLKHPEEKRSQGAVAARLADDLLREDPRCAWAYALKAEVVEDRLISEKADKKIRLLEKAVELDPKNAWMRAFLGRALSGLSKDARRIRLGLKQLDRAAALAPEIGWIRSWRAEVLDKLGEERRALKDLDAGIASDPDYRLANAWRAALRERRGDDAGAADDMAACTAVMPRANFLHQLALIRRRLGEDSAAAAALTASIGLGSKQALAYSRFSWLPSALARERGGLLRSGRRVRPAAGFRLEPMCEAEPWKGFVLNAAELVESAASHPEDAALRAWLGRAQLDLGQWETAEDTLTRAHDLDPRGFAPLSWRGEARFMRGDWAGALRDLDEAVALKPAYLPSHFWRALAHWSLDQAPRALDDLLEACRADPASAALVSLWSRWTIPGLQAKLRGLSSPLPLAEFLVFAGRYRQAAAVLGGKSGSQPGAEGWILRGFAYGQAGKAASGEPEFSRAVCVDARAAAEKLDFLLKRMPQIRHEVVVAAYYSLAEGEALAGREAESRRAYATALELDGARAAGAGPRRAPG